MHFTKGDFSITDSVCSFTLPVFVLLRLFLEKMTQCINKYIHKYAKHLLWRKMKGGKKNQVTVNLYREKNIPDGCPRNQPKYSLKRQWWPAKTNIWLTELLWCKYESGLQFLLKDGVLKKKKNVHCASKKSGGLRLWTQKESSPHNSGDVSKVIIREPCTQNYLITVHMFIYSTTTSICAFWTVTKWCFIACCIDDAKYNCSSTILE